MLTIDNEYSEYGVEIVLEGLAKFMMGISVLETKQWLSQGKVTASTEGSSVDLKFANRGTMTDRRSESPPRPDLHARENCKRLAIMLMRLFDLWELREEERLLLLGFPEDSRETLRRLQQGEPLDDNLILLRRAGHLLAIHAALCCLISSPRDLRYRWVKAPNRRFAGRAPLEIMCQSYEGLVTVRRYLEQEGAR